MEEPVFRFLGLPLELRNQVYWHLLTLTKEDTSERQVCSPEILYTSRQVHDEASGILYAEQNELVLTYDAAAGMADPTFPPLRVSINGQDMDIENLYDLRQHKAILPDHLLKFERLRASVSLSSSLQALAHPLMPGQIQLNKAIYALQAHLMASYTLKKLSVQADRDGLLLMPHE